MTTPKRDPKKKFQVVRRPSATVEKIVADAPAIPETTTSAVETEQVAVTMNKAPAPAAAPPKATEAPLAACAPVAKIAQKEKAASEIAVVAVWTEWPGKALDIWKENTTAMMDFATALSKAKDLSEIVTLQSQFMNDRFGTYTRLSSEACAFAQDVAKGAGSSVTKSLFVVC
jgi:hypothetical protein